ncbi:MAG TPA: site-2 protease family protein [Gemmataceae bacterium]|nr:site-2 protease family protein [Gemmataceae bacterium]
MFYEPQRTAYDLNWRMFGIQVRVHPFFWAIAAILGWGILQMGFEFLALWIACVFVSILIHELGHVFAGRLFGAYGHIVLYSFGGLAIGSNSLPNRWQRIAVMLAGPGAGFLLGGLVWLGAQQLDLDEASPLILSAISFLIWINFGWGLLNLLPVWPLDGGQVNRDLCEWLFRPRGVRIAYGISIAVAGLLAVNALANYSKHPLPILDQIPFLNRLSGLYTAFMFGFLAYNSYQMLQFENSRRPWDRDGNMWQ